MKLLGRITIEDGSKRIVLGEMLWKAEHGTRVSLGEVIRRLNTNTDLTWKIAVEDNA